MGTLVTVKQLVVSAVHCGIFNLQLLPHLTNLSIREND